MIKYSPKAFRHIDSIKFNRYSGSPLGPGLLFFFIYMVPSIFVILIMLPYWFHVYSYPSLYACVCFYDMFSCVARQTKDTGLLLVIFIKAITN